MNTQALEGAAEVAPQVAADVEAVGKAMVQITVVGGRRQIMARARRPL